MTDLPYFNFYPKDFASDGKVEAMTTEEIGAYILLLAKAWHEQPPCSVPDDNSILARWTRLGDDGWLRARPRVVVCFYLRDGRLFQPRLELEYRKARSIRNKQAEGGKKGAAKKWDSHRSPNGSAIGHPCHPDPKSELDKSNPPAPVGSLDPRAAHGIRNLKVSQGVRRELEGCCDITVSELSDVIESIRARGDAKDEDIVVAAELLRRRGKRVPDKKGPMARPLALARPAMPESINGLAAIVNNRRRA